MKAIITVQLVVEGLPDNVKPEHISTEIPVDSMKFLECKWNGQILVRNDLADARVTAFCTDSVEISE